MYKIIFVFIVTAFFSLKMDGQETKDALSRLESGEDLKVIYRNSASFGVFIHSAGGLGIAYRRGQQVNVDRKRMFEIESSNFKHAKEVKSINGTIASANGYYFGKLNSILLFRSGVGYQNVLFQKTDKKNVQIRYCTFVGAVLAFAKPVYLEYRTFDSVSEKIVSRKFDPAEPDQANIVGKAPFFKGIEKTKLVPGAYAKLGLSFEYADRYNKIKAIETGVIADVYPTALEIIANNKNQYLYVSLYIKMIFGVKWF